MEIFDLEVFRGDRLELLGELIDRLDRGIKTFIVTLNAQIALRARKDPVYREVLRSSDVMVVDGKGVAAVLSLKYLKKIETYPGIELMIDLLAFSRLKGWAVYLLGSEKTVVERLARMLKEEGINVVGYHDGYFRGRGPIDEMLRLKPDLVFVAMGAPKQEEWIYSSMDRFEKGVFMGVGGSFDVLSGLRKRAPLFVRRLGLEWFYRFLREPKKRWKVPFQIAEFSILGLLDIASHAFR